MSMKFWNWFAGLFIIGGAVMLVWGLVSRNGGDGLASDIEGQTFMMIGGIFILVGIVDLAIFRLFKPLTDASDNIMISQGYKPGLGGTMRMASDRMQAASATMAAFNAGPALSNALAVSGVDGTATVTGSRPTGQQSNLNPVYELDMSVSAAGMAPYDVTHTTEVNTLRVAQVAVGRQLPVRVNPADPSQMLVQWEKVPV